MIGPALEMTGVSKTFAGVSALEDAHLSIEAGEAHALMGANGAGKSTLMNILGGIVAAESGEICHCGPHGEHCFAARRARQRDRFRPSGARAARVYVGGGERAHRRSSAARRPHRHRRHGRPHAADSSTGSGCGFGPQDPVEKLGMGDRQMVEIARALASNPSILIFDEPTSSLSAREKARLFAVIRKLKAEGAAIIYVTHFIDEIFEICERVTVMRNGRIVGSGATADFTPGDIVKLMLGDIHQADRLRVTPCRVRRTRAHGRPVFRRAGFWTASASPFGSERSSACGGFSARDAPRSCARLSASIRSTRARSPCGAMALSSRSRRTRRISRSAS